MVMAEIGCLAQSKMAQFMSEESIVRVRVTVRVAGIRCIFITFHNIHPGMVYYAFYLSSGNLGGSLYVNFALMAVMGLPSEAINGCLCRVIGRKKTTIVGMLSASIFCFSLAFLHGDNLTIVRITCALIGNLFIGE